LNRVRLDIATQEAELAKVRASAQPTLDPSAASRPTPAQRRVREERPMPPIAEPPRVVSIVGMADKLRATVLTAGGATITALKGDVLDGGWVVRDIEATTVTVAHGTQVVVLKP
jgi:type IV pilus biogenesis protein PilP